MLGILEIKLVEVVLFSVDEHMTAERYRKYALECPIDEDEEVDPLQEMLFHLNINGDIQIIQDRGYRAAISYKGPDPREVLSSPDIYIESYVNEGIVVLKDKLEE